MKALIRKTFSDKFFSATIWVFLATGFLNFGNYLYHLLMGRMLGTSLYGALESLISLLYILFVPTLALNFVIVKFISNHRGKGEEGEISKFYNFLLGKMIVYGIIFFLVLMIFSPVLKNFLHLPSIFLVVILSLTFLVNFIYSLNKGLLQGVSSFFSFSLLTVIETGIKLFLGVGLVYLGYKVDGAFVSIGIGFFVAYILSHFLTEKDVKVKFSINSDYSFKKELIKFAFPTFITTLALTSLFTTDIILVRHFLTGIESGYYSALSVLGKIIYFASYPIVLVIFPMVSENHAQGKKYTKFLFWGFLITLAFSLLITGIYFASSGFMVELLFGKHYLPAATYLGLFGIFVSLYSLCSLFANFYLSIHQTKTSVLIALAAISQIILILLFHENIEQVIWISITITFLLLISLLLYYPHATRAK